MSFSWRKYVTASPRTILIDDSEFNIDIFNEHGGIGILMPGLHNRRHEEYEMIMERPEEWIAEEFKQFIQVKA